MKDIVDPRLHGSLECPNPCADCESGHHWIASDSVDDGTHPVSRYDHQHGTEHALGFYACKHCDTWAEAELIFELEDESEVWS